MTTGRINQVTVHLSPHKTCGPRRVLALADVPSTCLVTLQLRQQTELLKRRLTSPPHRTNSTRHAASRPSAHSSSSNRRDFLIRSNRSRSHLRTFKRTFGSGSITKSTSTFTNSYEFSKSRRNSNWIVASRLAISKQSTPTAPSL